MSYYVCLSSKRGRLDVPLANQVASSRDSSPTVGICPLHLAMSTVLPKVLTRSPDLQL